MKLTALGPLLPALVFAFPAPYADSQPLSRSTADDPSGIHINKVIYGGTGCPQGSLNISLSDDGKVLPLVFGNSYSASIGPDVDVAQNRKNCQLNIDLQFSAGFQYTVYSADYYGYANLDSGVTGAIRAAYYFSGQTAEIIDEADLTGPFTGYYSKHDTEAIATWSPCGSEGLLNVNSEVALTTSSGAARGLLTTDRVDAKFVHQLYIK